MKRSTTGTTGTYARFEAADRAAWRAWLAEHHASSPGVWVVLRKKAGGDGGLRYVDAVEEALCFGWIDSVINPLDARRTLQLFSPRKPKGTWAKSNKDRVERLTAAGLMAPAGLAVIDAAKRDGSWSALDAIDALEVPADLAKALRAIPGARAGFDALAASKKKGMLWWVTTAKRAETRAARVALVARAAALGTIPLDERGKIKELPAPAGSKTKPRRRPRAPSTKRRARPARRRAPR